MLWVLILFRIISDVSFNNNGRWDLMHLAATWVRVKRVSTLPAPLVSWSWIKNLGTHWNDEKYLGSWHFLNLYTHFKQFYEHRCSIFKIWITLKSGSEWALYLLDDIIFTNLFFSISQFCNNQIPMSIYNTSLEIEPCQNIVFLEYWPTGNVVIYLEPLHICQYVT